MRSKSLIFLYTSMMFVLSMSFAVSSASGSYGQNKIVSIQGVTKIGKEKAIVEILVAVKPGEDAKKKARGILKRMVPDAVEIDSTYYSENGLVWDNFFDSNLYNDQVFVNYNDKNVPSGLNSNALLAAMDTWTDVSSSTFAFSYGGSVGRCPSLVKECKGPQKFDGNNDVGWLNLRVNDVLGVTWYGTQTDEFDIVLDYNYNWVLKETCSPNEYDVHSVWLHEFGHALGLGHSEAIEGAVMKPYYSCPEQELYQDDIDGITYLYPAGDIDEPPVVTILTPTDGDVFVNGTNIAFVGSADDYEDGDISTDISWTSNIDGSIGTGENVSAILTGDVIHMITSEVTDSAGNTVSDSITVTVGTPQTASAVNVESVTYTTSGGKNQNRHLSITVALLDDLGNPVGNASVSIDLYLNGSYIAYGDGITGSNGTITFTLSNAKRGCYTTTVTDVTVAEFTWNEATSPNEYCK